MENRQAAVAQAEAIIETRVQSFMHWIDDRAVVPVIQDLHETSEAMRLVELERARKLLAQGEDIDAVLEALSKGLTAKFLHGPQQALHHAQGDERARLAALLPQLFRTTPLAPPPARRPRAVCRAPAAAPRIHLHDRTSL